METNIDDMTGEALGYTMEQLFIAGARDVYYVPIYMKKNRPATMLTVICDEQKREAMTEILLRETTTFGIRYTAWDRETLDRTFSEIETDYGTVRYKTGAWHGEVLKRTPEYEDCKTLAQKQGVSFQQVYDDAKKKMKIN